MFRASSYRVLVRSIALLLCCLALLNVSACGDRFERALKNGIKESADAGNGNPEDGDSPAVEAALISGLWRIDPNDQTAQLALSGTDLMETRFLVAEASDRSEVELLFCGADDGSMEVMTLPAVIDQEGIYELPLSESGAVRFENRAGVPYVVIPDDAFDIAVPLIAVEEEKDMFTVSFSRPGSRLRVRNSNAVCGSLAQASAEPGSSVTGKFSFVAGQRIHMLHADIAGGLQATVADSALSLLIESRWFEDQGSTAQQRLSNNALIVGACSETNVRLTLRGDSSLGEVSIALIHELDQAVTCPSDNPPPADAPPLTPPPAPNPNPTPPASDPYAAKCGSLERPGGLTGRWGLNPATQSLIEVAVGDFPEFTQLVRSSFFFVDQQTEVSATICEDPRIRLPLTRNGDVLESAQLGLLVGGAQGVIRDITVKSDAEIILNLIDPPLPISLKKRPVLDQTLCWDESGLDDIRAVNQICAATLPTALRLTFPLQSQLMELIFNLPGVPTVGEHTLTADYTAVLISDRFTAMGMDKTQLIKEGSLDIQSIGVDSITGRFRLVLPSSEVVTGNFSSYLSRLAENPETP